MCPVTLSADLKTLALILKSKKVKNDENKIVSRVSIIVSS